MGDLKLLAAQRQRHYIRLADELLKKNDHAIPSSGGGWKSEKTNLSDNSNWVQPDFKRGMMDYN